MAQQNFSKFMADVQRILSNVPEFFQIFFSSCPSYPIDQNDHSQSSFLFRDLQFLNTSTKLDEILTRYFMNLYEASKKIKKKFSRFSCPINGTDHSQYPGLFDTSKVIFTSRFIASEKLSKTLQNS